MKTKIALSLIIILTTIAGCSALKAQATEPIKPSVVILDTSVNSSLPIFKERIIQEVCTLEWPVCSNQTGFQEGPGSASSLSLDIMKTNSFKHGTIMASISAQTNAYVNIVFVRIVGYKDGYRYNPTAKSVMQALDWVIANQSKYNIVAVAMSQSTHDKLTLAKLCPTNELSPYVDNLISKNIALFLPAGNDADLKNVDYPSCIPNAITVGALDKKGNIATYSNGNPSNVDFYALGHITTAINPTGQVEAVVGTSASTQIAAMQWATVKMMKPALTYSELLNLLNTTSNTVINGTIKGGKSINIEKAIK